MDTDKERAALIESTIGIGTLAQIEAARQNLWRWLEAHPGDEGIRELDSRLADEQRALEPQSPASFAYLTTSGREPLPPTGEVAGEGQHSAGSEA